MFSRILLVLALILVSTFSSGAYAQYGDFTSSGMTGSGFNALYNNTVLRHSPLGNIGTIYAEVRDGKTYVQVYGENALTTFTGMTALAGANQIPMVSSSALGTGVFVLDTANNTLSYNITFSGLGSAETGAHIHGPADTTTNAWVLWTLPAGSPKIGVWNYSQDQENDILAGKTYVNVHSTNYPNGEIRGQIYVPHRFILNTTNIVSVLNGIADKLGVDATTLRPFVLFRFVSLASTSDERSIRKEAIRNRLATLRQSYQGVFTSVSRKIDNINNNQKAQILTRLIDQIDMKVDQIRKSSRQLSNKQDLLLLYGDLRLLIQQKLINMWDMVRTLRMEDDILNDATDAQ